MIHLIRLCSRFGPHRVGSTHPATFHSPAGGLEYYRLSDGTKVLPLDCELVEDRPEKVNLPPEPKGKTKFQIWENGKPIGYLWGDTPDEVAAKLCAEIHNSIPGNAALSRGLFLSWTGGAQ